MGMDFSSPNRHLRAKMKIVGKHISPREDEEKPNMNIIRVGIGVAY